MTFFLPRLPLFATVLVVATVGCGRGEPEPGPAPAPAPAPQAPAVDTSPPKYKGKDFTFQLGWWFTPVTNEPGYDKDRRFTVVEYDLKDRKLAKAIVRFTIFDEVRDPAELLAETAAGPAEQYTATGDETFTKWGKYEGRGLILDGRDSRKARVTIRVFAFTASGKSVAVVELFPRGGRGEEGIENIRETFEFTTPK